MRRRPFVALALAAGLLAAPAAQAQPPAPQFVQVFLPAIALNALEFTGPAAPFGYGWGVFNWRAYWPANQQYPATAFGWIKITENPDPAQLCGDRFRLRYQVLLRLNIAEAGAASAAQAGAAAAGWAQALAAGPCVDAFEIGNEPNLSMAGAYNGPVDPERYADQLCAAYPELNAVHPEWIVVSAGLAPTAGLPDPALALTDTVFLRRMLTRIAATHAGDAGACFDVLGYHNYGFRTGYATDPADPACAERACFRGVEAAFTILREEFGVTKRVWSTEMGWLRDYTGACGAAPWAGIFGGFQVSDQGQAAELTGAFQYARQRWPWLGAMFVFNLDFDARAQDPCLDEQGWFAVKNHPAEAALESMLKP